MTLRYGALIKSLRSLRGMPHGPTVAPTHADVRYHARRGAIEPLADLYIPEKPNGASVVLVHGGAFVLGSRRMKPMRYLATQLVNAGVAVCVFDYRMVFRGGRLDEATGDVVDAFEFWSERARSIRGLDPDRISLAGLSAGATLSLLAAPRLNVRSVACAFGLYDVDHLRGPASLLPRLLLQTADRGSWNARLPRHHANHTTASTLLLHGTHDELVPVAQAHDLAAHRQTLGYPTKVVIYDGAPHGFFNLPVPEAAAAAREMIDHVTS